MMYWLINIPFKLDVILVSTLVSLNHIRDDVSSKQARRQISLSTSYGRGGSRLLKRGRGTAGSVIIVDVGLVRYLHSSVRSTQACEAC